MIKVIPQPVEVKVLSDSTFSYTLQDVKNEFEDLPFEGYRLVIAPNGVTSFARDDVGHTYAKVTLMQLLASKEALPHVEILDYPKYSYRGYMLDTCRHFFTIEEIKKQLLAISYLKLNIFHWHLTEDQGWRVQIDKYPLLTEIGSVRKQTRGDGKEVKGFYTKEQIKDVVEYASSLNIEIIPEIDIPGHFSSAICAYPYLSCDGKKVSVKECFGIHQDVCCAGKETTYDFLIGVLDEIFEMFPCKYLHLGGDEALRIKWIECKDCQKLMQEASLKDEDELQAYFMARLVDYAEKHGKIVLNWNDGMIAENVGKNIVVHYWLQTKVSKEAALRHINSGHKGVISPFYYYYLDYPYGMTPLRKTFGYSAEKEGFLGDNILGLEAPLWTEYVDSIQKVEYMTYPRLIALSEKAWSGERTTYKDFLLRTGAILNMFDSLGINYAKISEVDLKGIRKVKSLLKFLMNLKDPSSREHLKRVKLNKQMIKKKYK